MFSTYDLVEQCTDGVRNYDETGTDCGGANCNACASGGGGGGSTKKSGSGGGAGVPAPIKKINSTNITNTTINSSLNLTPKLEINTSEQIIRVNRTNTTQQQISNETTPFSITNIASIVALILVCVGLVFFLMKR